MKQFLLSLLCLMYVAFVQAQNTFSDDIESIQTEPILCLLLTGLCGPELQEKVLRRYHIVSNQRVHSGKQSIRLEAGSASSGPTDLVLPFGGEKNIGTFTYTMWVYTPIIPAGYSGIFQGKATIGSIWAVDNYVTSSIWPFLRYTGKCIHRFYL
ncbi:MAG: hypothetical protein U0T81_00765 [Saprospiraceae bacterium]